MGRVLEKLKQFLFSRMVVVGVLLLIQLLILLVAVVRLTRYFAVFYGFCILLSLAVTLLVINDEQNPSYKLAWIIPIMLFPLFGGLFYLLFARPHLSRKLSERIHREAAAQRANEPLCEAPSEALAKLRHGLQSQSRYIAGAGFAPYAGTETTFLPTGEAKWQALLDALEGARRYIFLEYFIIQEGKMWDAVLAVLERKAAQGVDVRVLYDGFGCLMTLPDGYSKTLEAKGIRCIEFNPLIPVLTILMNNRDHRKIAVVDGHTGFMGGVNLADEYINAYPKHGHWKDSAVMLRGNAVWALVEMFVTMWDSVSADETDLATLRPLPEELPDPDTANGIVQPYTDSPLDDEQVGESVYLNMINHAHHYLYISSPYLIVDNETVTALLLAAKSGVDVRIITPHIGDKWYVHTVTRAYYAQLVRGGVKIYEYTPGFIHAKVLLADDEVATVGTINLDYRSFYLHFECGVWMAHTDAIPAIRADFEQTLALCEPITLQSPQLQLGVLHRLINAVLRLLAPLM